MGVIRIAQAQINVTVGDFSGNLEKIAGWVGKARDAGSHIVTFPELALCGYPPEDLLIKPRFLRDNRLALERLVSQCTGITAVVGFADWAEGIVYNAAALVHDGTLVGVYHKIELPNYGVFDEKRYFAPGSNCLVFEMGGMRFSIAICEDLWIPGSITEDCALRNRADAVLSISGSPFFAGKLAVRWEIAARFARATRATVFYNNLVGGQDELVFDGGSMVVDQNGLVLARAKRFEEDLLLIDMQTSDSKREPAGWRLTGNRDAPHRLDPLATTDLAMTSPTLAREPDRLEEVYQALVVGTRDYVLKNGFKKVVIGVSGGIDSALTAAIAVDGLGPENVIGVTMPSQYTSSETFSDAEIVARNLGVELLHVPIRTILESYLDELKDAFGPGQPGIEQENLQARIRGNILMALSNRFGWLVLTTGNKSETAVGYSTLYGDMAGGFAVVKDVPKTVVYELAEYVNREAGREIIPRSVIQRPPTAELRPDQKDEDSLPPYGVLDRILRCYVEEDKAPDEISSEGFDPALVDEVIRMVDRNEYKRRQAPPGVKITPKAFGRDRRLPITNRYRYRRSFW